LLAAPRLTRGSSSTSSKHTALQVSRSLLATTEGCGGRAGGGGESNLNLLGLPLAISISVKGVSISIFDRSVSHCLELRADRISASCLDRREDATLTLWVQVGDVLVWCGSAGADSSPGGVTNTNTNTPPPPPPPLPSSPIFVFEPHPLFRGCQAAAAGTTAVDGHASGDSGAEDVLSRAPPPFLKLQVHRNLACTPGVVHIASAALSLSSSALLTVDEAALIALVPIALTTLSAVRGGWVMDLAAADQGGGGGGQTRQAMS
jgi:hypothetical protein